MNLHQIVSGAISAVNPFVDAIVRRSDGWVQARPGAQRVPSYKPDETISIQFQPLSSDDLRHVDGMNMQGYFKSVHVNGNFYGTLRKEKLGGDLIIVGNDTWLVVEPLELWPDWCRLLVRLQVD